MQMEVDNTLRDLHNFSYRFLRKSNSIIAILVIQNNSKFKNKRKHAYPYLTDVKFISIVHLYREV